MARDENPPFELGQTYFNGNTPDTAVGNHLLGKIWRFEDVDFGVAGVKPRRTGLARYMMAVRNTSGGLLLPKYLGKMDLTGTLSTDYNFSQNVVGYPALGDIAFPIDEFLPAAGVAANDIFWVCVGGPAKVKTDTAGTTTVAVGGGVVGGAGTIGRVVAQNVGVSAGSATFAQLKGLVGYAITPVAADSTDFLMMVIPKFPY